jgi:hypothetical protein
MKIRSTFISIILGILIHDIMAIDDVSSELNIDFPDSCKPEFRNDNWKDCAKSLSTLIWNTHSWYDNQPITICELRCTRKLKGHISNFQWVWDAEFECAERAPGIIGEGRGFKTRRIAMEHAITHTIERAITTGKLTALDFKC